MTSQALHYLARSRGLCVRLYQTQVESLVLARDSAAANHKRELAAAQRDAAQVEAQHKSAAASWHTDLDWHRSEVGHSCVHSFCMSLQMAGIYLLLAQYINHVS